MHISRRTDSDRRVTGGGDGPGALRGRKRSLTPSESNSRAGESPRTESGGAGEAEPAAENVPAIRRTIPAAAAALLLLAAPTAAHGQLSTRAQAPGVAEVRAGAASPKGDLGDINDDGVLIGMALGYRVFPRLELRGQLDLENLERGGRPSRIGGLPGPQTHLLHYLAGFQVELTDPQISKWEIAVNALAGGTRVEVEDGPPAVPDYSGHQPTVHLSWQFGYDLFDSATLYARAGGYGMLGDREEFPTYLGKEFVLTQSGGLRIRF